MNQVQEILLELLIEIDELCEKHGVTYYLAAGGALGAVRNGGFLPWDDDLDLYITRENWNKLVEAMKTEDLPSNRSFVHTDNTDLYCNPIGRYVNNDTTLMMNSQMLCGKCCGYVVEFFIMDPMPLSEDGKMEHRRYMKAYTELLSPYFVLSKGIFAHNIDFDFKLYNRYYWLSKIIGKERALKLLLDKFTNTSEDDSDMYCMRWGQRTIMFKKESLGTPKQIMFEGKPFPTVGDPETVFRDGYGDDWMYVPPIPDQRFHDLDHDLEEPFETYTKMYMPLLEKEKLWKAYNKRKRTFIRSLTDKEAYIRDLAFMKSELCGEQIKESSKAEEALSTLLKERKFDELNKELAQFYALQGQAVIRENDIMLPVSDNYFYIALMNYIYQGLYHRASKLLKVRIKTGVALSKKLVEAKLLIEFCRRLSIAIFDKHDIHLAEEELNSNKKYADVIDYVKAELWIMCERCTSMDDYRKLQEKAHAAASLYNNDGEVLRYEAYALHCLGQKEEAKELYETVIYNTRNGLVWREANELYGLDAYKLVDSLKEYEKDPDEDEESIDE